MWFESGGNFGGFLQGCIVGGFGFDGGTLPVGSRSLRLRRDPALAAAWARDEAATRSLVQRYLRPRPALALRAALRAHASAAMDVSDGLVKDLDRMCRASGAGACVIANHVPLSAAARAALRAQPALLADLLTDLLTGGDDYEVLIAVPVQSQRAFEWWPEAASRYAMQTVRIFSRTGWDHFR